MHRAGEVAEFPNITANFVTSADSPTRKIVIELATAPDEGAIVKRFEESFTGSLTSFLVSPRLAADKDNLETAVQMTARRLMWAREASRIQLTLATCRWGWPRPGRGEYRGASSGTYELVEAYPDDKYFPSYLTLARRGPDAVHVLFATDVKGNNVRVVTSYRPASAEWQADLKARRPKR